MVILTQYDPPPVPDRNYDWMATRKDWDEGDPIGYGKTEEEAITNLLIEENDRY